MSNERAIQLALEIVASTRRCGACRYLEFDAGGLMSGHPYCRLFGQQLRRERSGTLRSPYCRQAERETRARKKAGATCGT